MTYSNGDRFEGTWENGQKYGIGKFYILKDIILKMVLFTMENGSKINKMEKVFYCIKIMINMKENVFIIFKGLDGQKSGQGTYYYNNGERY